MYTYDPAKFFSELQEACINYAHTYLKTAGDHVGIDLIGHVSDSEDEAKELQETLTKYVETQEFKEEWHGNQLLALAEIKSILDKVIEVTTNEDISNP